MPSCPSCRRPVAVPRASCVYCGAPLPPAVADEATSRAETRQAPAPAGERLAPARTLVVIDLEQVDAEALARAIDLSPYEATLLTRRRGFHLHRVLAPEQAESEAARLAAAGIAALLVPESEARVRPLRAVAGELTAAGLVLRTEEGSVGVQRGTLLIVVTGPITRQRQASPKRPKVATATLEEGWCVHLHRVADPRPIEIDADAFEPGFAAAGSTRLELRSWLGVLAEGVPHDDAFRLLTPALAPAEAPAGGPLSVFESLRERPPAPAAVPSGAKPRLAGPRRARSARQSRAVPLLLRLACGSRAPAHARPHLPNAGNGRTSGLLAGRASFALAMRLVRREFLVLLLLAVAPVLAYAPALRAGRMLAPRDGAALHLPLRVEVWRAYSRGELPSWNPTAFSGTPLLASYRPGALHPLMVGLAPLPPLVAFQALVLLSLGATGPLVYLYARRLGAETKGALVAALGFALGPYLVERLEDTPTLVAAPALPLVLLAAESLLARGRAASVAALAGAVALLALAGSPEAAGAGAILLTARLSLGLLWAAHRADPAEAALAASRTLATVAAVLAGIFLAAPQLVPTLLALAEAGPSGPSGGAPLLGSLGGVAGLVVRSVSHTPAAIFALAAVPLIPAVRGLRATAALVGVVLLTLAARGRLEGPGALPLALDLALSVLAGVSLSAQWRLRGEPRGRRLRLLAVAVALAAAAALSIATIVTGPLNPRLAAPVGLLALGLILYFALAESSSRASAQVFLLPLLASFLMQPWGRENWAGAPTARELGEATPTRAALDRVMGPRRAERSLVLAESRPSATAAADLGWGGYATFAGRRGANGYDPLVPATRRRVFDGMRADGTLPRALLETDPGRLELLGIRWLQVPTDALVQEGGADGPRRRARRRARTATTAPLRAADHPRERAADRELPGGRHAGRAGPDRRRMRRAARHRPRDLAADPGRRRHRRVGVGPRGRAAPRQAREGAGLRELPGARGLSRPPVLERAAPAGSLLRLLPALPSVARGPASVAAAGRAPRPRGRPLDRRGHRLGLRERRGAAGAGRAHAARQPLRGAPRHRTGLGRRVAATRERRGARARRPALADPARGRRAPRGGRDGSRRGGARAAGWQPLLRGRRGQRPEARRIVVRAAGPGLLVVAEGYDPGWTATVDARPARIVRVNGDRMAVALGEGHHRVVLRHHARGLVAGAALALLALAALAVAVARERRERRRPV